MKQTPTAAQMLPPLADLLARFDAAGIRVCHFKSNRHLDAALNGETDLDLLMHPDDRRAGEQALAATGFKEFRAIGHLAYPGVVDYLGFDPASGRMAHLHLHYRLVLGERHLKGYRIPWEEAILAERQRDAASGFPISSPEWELLLLLVRAALKLRLRDGLLRMSGLSWCDTSIAAEFPWLLARVARPQVIALAERHLGVGASRVIEAILTRGRLTPCQLARLRRAAAPELSAWRSHGRLAGWMLRHSNEIAWLVGGMRRRWLTSPVRPSKRISMGGGIVVAVLGCDGSGKSTVVRELAAWLRWKLDVHRAYYGSGDGQVSWYRWPLWRLHRMLRKNRPSRGSSASTGRVGWAKAVWALVLADEKSAKLRRHVAARNLGSVVLTDRYPQLQVAGFNDGPLLEVWKDSPTALARWLASAERSRLARFERCPPDLVIKLTLTAEQAFARKPEGDVAEVARRVDAVRSLVFPASTRVVEVDAAQPLEEVLRRVKSAVWERL